MTRFELQENNIYSLNLQITSFSYTEAESAHFRTTKVLILQFQLSIQGRETYYCLGLIKTVWRLQTAYLTFCDKLNKTSSGLSIAVSRVGVWISSLVKHTSKEFYEVHKLSCTLLQIICTINYCLRERNFLMSNRNS